MRLQSIKLAGFKSFADPTTFDLPGQLVGVVGPNGCGKSNIMDAVRWVLGESKASELRGESMQDVIFNGTTSRKPAGRASVELVFDNTLARAGGQWNQFGEIAVKRVLTRDGNSSYYINNQVVRRRDVQDVFLGTGLGPRAYAIIGQGTISRIIESRPEELRLFLEEAAGVSKYKERRRETEARLRDTRENLTRVEDILRELNANLEKLERQAEVATRYRALQEQGTTKLHQLWFLKHQDAAAEAQRVSTALRDAETQLEAQTAQLREAEASLETLRQAHYGASDDLHEAQGALGEAAAAVSRLEERIRLVVEGRERALRRLGELKAQVEQWQHRQAEAHAALEGLAEQQRRGDEEAEILAAQVEDGAQALPALEDALRSAQQVAAAQRQKAADVQQQIQLLAAESRNIDEQLRGVQSRRERLQSERRALVAPEARALEAASEAVEECRAVAEEAAEQVAQWSDAWPSLDATRRQTQADAAEVAARYTSLQARLDALRALQERVHSSGRLRPWLSQHGLESLPALWTRLQVDPGWEPAVEAALRERLQALEVGRLDVMAGFADDAPPARLAFFSVSGAPTAAPDPILPTALGEESLARRVRVVGSETLQYLVHRWLGSYRCATDVAQALRERDRLLPGQTWITAGGHAIDGACVVFYAPDSEQAGVLARAQEMERLEVEVKAQSYAADAARAAMVRAEAAANEAQQRLAAARQQATTAQTTVHQAEVQLLQLKQQAQAAAERAGQMQEALADLTAEDEALQERRALGEARFEDLDLQLATEQERHAEYEERVMASEKTLADAREALRRLERQAQEAQFAGRSLEARAAELQRSIHTAQEQAEAARHAQAQAEAELITLDDAAAQEGLQDALGLKQTCEEALSQVRQQYDLLSQQLRQADEQRLTWERGLQPQRDRITQLQLEAQAAALGGAQYLEQLEAAGVDQAALAAAISADGVKLWGLQGEIDRIQKEINALGAVNLAALEELSSARDRKVFLDAQLADLTAAIETLEDAIRKIDLETRDLLGETFRKVNDHFSRMFPSLFGGGQARLMMTGDEILDAGVQVMAQPPGKKNSTIHLLSGGEKALTAIALVFAIFQLNPAPFCLLDEVDAPLDDANTERYARLVAQMSSGTQFLFISHNKIAMEMAQQLVGVTMQEQGVSRIVAVDMESALTMAETA